MKVVSHYCDYSTDDGQRCHNPAQKAVVALHKSGVLDRRDFCENPGHTWEAINEVLLGEHQKPPFYAVILDNPSWADKDDELEDMLSRMIP